ncbi:MAG: endo-1,4-beta-xylanase [Phycisphaerae bacterium]|nr:endo-1,4-beta-xylanase [Phycisphaerae bacterium]
MRSFVVILGVALLCASCVSPAQSQTTLDGNSLAYRSTGASCKDKAWSLNENGFVGTYVRIPAANKVSFTIRASKSRSETRTPMLGLRIGDFAASWPVTAAGTNYSSHTQVWTLPAGTYCVRVENINDKPSGGPWAINVRDLTIAAATVLNKAANANALAAADTYIDHFRKGPATLTLMDKTQPLANAPLRIRLKRHAFNFGTAVSGVRPGRRRSSWRTGSDRNDINYRNFVINNFNTVVPENAGKWTSNERTRDRVTLDYLDSLLKFAALNGKRVRMHGVLWDVNEPRWVNALQHTAINGTTQAERDAAKTDLRAQISERIKYFVRNRATRYYELDVINEAVHKPIYYRIYGRKGVAGIYNEVKAAVLAAGASTRLVPNEYDVFQGSGAIRDPYANWYRKHVERLRKAGGAVDGIGIQYYAVAGSPPEIGPPHSPSRISGVLHNLATANLPLSITEFGVQSIGPPTPQRVADILAETLRLCFGHEKMTTFINWGFWSSRMWSVAPAGALMDAKWKITPAGMVWQQLTGVKNWAIANQPTWTTDVSGATDARGRVNFVGFYGDYEIISGKRRGRFTLTKGTTGYKVVVSFTSR